MAEMPTRQQQQADPRRFGGAWAKIEIFLGLTAAGLGLFLGNWLLTRPQAEIDWPLVAAGLTLFVLGGYLALAGQRSHLYRSNLLTAAALAEAIQNLHRERLIRDEHSQ
ncbi:MAG: hypothetical protein L0Z62_19405 [Gemmataceae bacterium]|nr:hypothetical protein [Gemmataceae bacterium]